MTSSHICKVAEFTDCTFLKAQCCCGSDNHIQTLVLELDEYNVSLSLYSTAYAEYYDSPLNESIIEHIKWWFDIQKKKISWIRDILFKGYVKVENTFLFENEQSINDYIIALQEAKERLKNDNA